MGEEKEVKKETAKKKLNVVFRGQNAQNKMELPKSLKNAAGASGKKENGNVKVVNAEKKGPRPLPAGTKPVKPAVYGETPEEKVSVHEKKAEFEAKAAEQKAAEAEARAKAKTASSVQAGGVFVIKKPKKTEEVPETPETSEKVSAEPAAKAPEKTAEKKTEGKEEQAAPARKAEKEVKAPVKSQTEEPKKAKPVKENPAPEKKPETPQPPKQENKKESVKIDTVQTPHVKIIKSYAGYDANAVIREATQAQKKAEAINRQKSGEQKDVKGGRTFIARNPRAGEEGNRSGQRPGGNRPQGGRPGMGAGAQGQRNFGQSAPQPGAFEGHAGKGAASKGRNAYANKDKDRKDKYRDEPQQPVKKTGKGAFIKPEIKQEKPEDDIKVIVIPESLTIKDLSDKLKVQPSVIIKKLFLEGKMVTPNTDISYEEAEEIAMEYDILCEKEVPEDVIAELLAEGEEDESKMVKRPPVVCVMGHVDHGKTSLLDAIRKTNVTSHEAGGITQAIGASVVKIGGRNITFLDTPGHEAFTAMRLRGAQATDIAVLVVAADDGVKPQTVEAINHAKSAGVEVVVAINKIDKPDANIDKVKKELTNYELVAEEWGGSTPMVPVSAKTGEGIEDLLEMILLEADVLELKADPDRGARGIVIEAELDKGRGPVATVLVQKGTLKVGDNVAAGACYGKVRAMLDDKGARVKKAGPSTPVEILGLNDVPNAGEVFMGCVDEKEARNIADTFIAENKKAKLAETKQKMNLDDLFDEIQAGNLKELPIIIKADVQGSVEAVKQSLGKMGNEEVVVKVIHSGVGNINESDVSLASAANAIIIGFNVKPDAVAKSTAEHEKVDIRLYKVIYQAIDDLEAALTGMLAPTYEEKITGHAIVRQLFKASGVGTIAGCFVTDGLVERGSKARITRGDKQIFEGDIASLKRFKDEVKEVKNGFECGMVFEGFSDLQEDDQVEIFKMVEVPRTPKKEANV